MDLCICDYINVYSTLLNGYDITLLNFDGFFLPRSAYPTDMHSAVYAVPGVCGRVGFGTEATSTYPMLCCNGIWVSPKIRVLLELCPKL